MLCLTLIGNLDIFLAKKCNKESVEFIKVSTYEIVCADFSIEFGNERAYVEFKIQNTHIKFNKVFKTMRKFGSKIILGMIFLIENFVIINLIYKRNPDKKQVNTLTKSCQAQSKIVDNQIFVLNWKFRANICVNNPIC